MDLQPNIITSIKELMMDQYIDCVCHGNLRALSPDGAATDEALQQAWRQLRSDYMEASADAQAGHVLATGWDAESFVHLSAAVRELLRWFDMVYDERFAQALRELGYDYAFLPETYKEDMQHVLTELACEELRLKEATAALADAEKPNTKPTEQSFYKTIVMLQKHLGIFPNTGPMLACRQMTVYEFVTYTRMYNELMTRQTLKQDGTGY